MKLWHVLVIMALMALVSLAFYGGVGYVVVHFLRKWW